MSPEELPVAVRAAFANRFPSAQNAKWERKNDEYGVVFQENGRKRIAYFDPAGKWKETDEGVVQTTFPAVAKQYLDEHYAKKRIRNITKFNRADGSRGYVVRVKRNLIVFDEKGAFVQTTKLRARSLDLDF